MLGVLQLQSCEAADQLGGHAHGVGSLEEASQLQMKIVLFLGDQLRLLLLGGQMRLLLLGGQMRLLLLGG